MSCLLRAGLLAFGIAAFVAGAAPADARRHGAPSTGLAPIAFGRPAPDFSFGTASAPQTLAALRGRPVVVNFWATYCEPCLAEFDAFARLRETYGDRVDFVAVSTQDHSLTDSLLHTHVLGAISVADPEHTIFTRYGVTPIPVTLVLNADGTVSHVSVGQLDWNELQAAVAATLPVLPSVAPEPQPTS